MQIQAENTASVAAETVEAKAQLQVALARIAELEAALEKQEAITKEDAKWSMVYHQWCVMNGCAPSSSNLIAALDVLEEKKVITKQTTPFQLTVEENNANHSLNVIVLQKRITELEAALRHLDDMIVDLDAGHIELHQASRFINATLEGGKDD